MVIYTPNNPRDNGALVGWLTAFGIDPERLVFVDRSNSTVYYADELYIPYPSRTKFPSPATLQAARKVIFEKLQLNHHLPGIVFLLIYPFRF